MYKTASKNLQKSKGRDVSKRIRVRDYVGNKGTRTFFFSVIFHAAQNNLDFSQVQRLPNWLKREVTRAGIVDWLAQHSSLVRSSTIQNLRKSLMGKPKPPRPKKRKIV